jgi:hypothetical protein
LAAVSEAIKVWLVEPDDVMYLNPAEPDGEVVSVGVVLYVAATRPAFVVVVAPTLLTVEAIADAGDNV